MRAKNLINQLNTVLILLLVLVISRNTAIAQSAYCDSTVPSFVVDLSGSPTNNWISPVIVRDGNCCNSVNPDVCLEFVITLNPNTIAVNFNIASGAVPPGALYYQIDCGPPTPVGSPICLNGPGPHHLTFCKPGNNANTFSITTYAEPIVGPDITLNAGCSGFLYANYYNVPSITWNSIYPGNPGDYNYLLSCTSGCDTTYLTAPMSGPPYVDYLICGLDLPNCNPNPVCDTVRVYLVPPVDVNITSNPAFICGGGTATLTANLTGGSAPYNYLWSTGQTTGSIVVGPGTYYVEVSSATGCITTYDTLTVPGYPAPIAEAGPVQTVCFGTAVVLSGSGTGTPPLSYSWNGGVVDGVPFVPPVGTNVYTLTITDGNGCTDTDQAVVFVKPLPTANAGPDQTACLGETVTLSYSGNGLVNTISWTGGVTNNVPFTPPLGTSTYIVTVGNNVGCYNSDTVDVIVNPLPIVVAGPDQIVCEGTAVTVNGSGASTYTWDNGVTDGVPFISPVGNTTYTVTGTDANGCSNTDQLVIIVNPLPIVDAGPDQIVCEGEAVTLSGSGASTYAWDNGVVNNSPFIPSVGTTTYTVTGTDGNGCVNTDQVIVTVNPLPSVNAGPDQTICVGEQVILSGSGASTYSWDNGVQDGIAFTPAIGSVTYTVTGTDINGCVNTDQVEVTVNPLPVVDAGADQEFCDGTSVTLTGSGASSYSWNNGVIDGQSFIPPVGTTVYTVTGTDTNGCVAMDSVEILINPLPNVNAGPDQIVCEGSPVTLSATGAVNFTWNNGVIDGVPFVQAVGTVIYTVVGVDANGCVNEDEASITVNPNPIVDAGIDQSLCEGTELVLLANGSPNLSWNNGVQNGVPFTPAPGLYTFIVSDSLPTGCTATDSVIIEVFPNPIVVAIGDTICQEVGVVLLGQGQGQGAMEYSWSGGITNGVEFFPVSSGEYILTGTDENGCSSQDTAIVVVYDLPNVSFSIDNLALTTLNPTTSFTNYTTGAVSYFWDFGDGGTSTQFEPTHSYSEESGMEYAITLTAYSEEGCVNELTKYVHVMQEFTIYVPNAFTPDGDNYNGEFKPVMWGFDEADFEMLIFDRWGELVFETHDMNIGWDGTYAAQNYTVQDGVYTWKIEAKLKDSSDSKLFVGHVVLIK